MTKFHLLLNFEFFYNLTMKNQKTGILFVCHGNICRSPMAEFIMKSLAEEAGLSDRFTISSKATSTEELGNPIYPPAKAELNRNGIRLEPHYASQVTRGDYNIYDYIIVMDSNNMRNIMRIMGTNPSGKIYKLLDFTDTPGDIADPWFSNNFSLTFRQIKKGCECLLERLIKE